MCDSVLHPDTGKPIFPLFRFSAFAPANIPIAAMLLYPSSNPVFVMTAQFINQTYNVCVNYANRNASSEMPMSTLLTGEMFPFDFYLLIFSSVFFFWYFGTGREEHSKIKLQYTCQAKIYVFVAFSGNVADITFVTSFFRFNWHTRAHALCSWTVECTMIEITLNNCLLLLLLLFLLLALKFVENTNTSHLSICCCCYFFGCPCSWFWKVCSQVIFTVPVWNISSLILNAHFNPSLWKIGFLVCWQPGAKALRHPSWQLLHELSYRT